MKKCALLLLLPFAVLAKDPPQNQVSVQIASNDTRDVREGHGLLVGSLVRRLRKLSLVSKPSSPTNMSSWFAMKDTTSARRWEKERHTWVS